MQPTLTMACWNYDRTRPLIDGRIKPSGFDLKISVMRPRQAFERMLATGEYDICEMSMATYVGMRAEADCPLIALPVMLSKMFRHDCFYIHKNAGINVPRDLAGKRVGTMRYSSTALVFARGLLQHDIGVDPTKLHWFIGGINEGIDATIPVEFPRDTRLTLLDKNQTLDKLLAAGDVDALITQDFPDSFLRKETHIERLFRNFKEAETDYYNRTKIFPIMHTIVVKTEFYKRYPDLVKALYDSFVAAKDIALNGLHDTDALHLALPFLIDHVEEAQRIFGDDFFSYGVEPNRPTLNALCKYVHEQGLSKRLVSPDELFAPTN